MIDGGLFLGRNPATGQALPCVDLTEYLNRHGIEAAIAGHYQAIYFDTDEGNAALLNIARAHPGRIIPAVHLSPVGFEAAARSGSLSGLRQAGARVLCVMQQPSYYPIPFGSPLLRRIVEESVQAGLTIQFSVANHETLCETFQYFGDLPTPFLVRWLGGGAYQSLAEAMHLLTEHSLALFDVGSLTTTRGIERLVEAVGGHRLYLASNAPESYPLCAPALLYAARLPETVKADIAHNNLARLFDLPQRPTAELPPLLPRAVRELFARDKIDSHYHFSGWNALEAVNTRESALASLGTHGTTHLIMSSSRALNYDMAAGNQELRSVLESDPRLYGHIVIDPLQVEASIAEVERYAGHPKFVGIKTIQDLYGLSLDDENYRCLFEAVNGFGLPVLAHKVGMDEAAQRFPRITFINAHANWQRSCHLTGRANICFDLVTSHACVAESRLDLFIAQAGAGRVLYGSDCPLISPAWTLGKLACLDLSEDQLRAILVDNARRIYPKLGD